MTSFELRVLGPLGLTVADVEVDVAGRHKRTLLAVLACRANTVVPVGRLVQELWDPETASARKNLQVYVHRLRRVVGEGRLVHSAGGYQLSVLPDEMDALRFADLAAQGRAARQAQRAERAHHLLRQALGLWRGEPYADVVAGALVAEEVHRLAERRLLAQEECLAAELDLGRHVEAIPELVDLTRRQPYRERLRGFLMLALFRAGRRAEALDVFRQARALLAEELGIEPGDALQRLHQAVLRGDGMLASVAVDQLDHLSGPEQLAVASTSALARQLPADAYGFVGRHAEHKELDELLPGQARAPAAVVIAAIAGTAGVGKTALAVHWAHRVCDWFPDGQLFVDLQGYAAGRPLPPLEALARLIRALGLPAGRVPAEVETAAGLYRSLLADKRVLVLLDNAASAEQVRPLLPASPGCLVLVTSRNRLGGLVAREGARRIILDVLPPEDAVTLLASIMGADRVSAEPETAAELARLCAYLPLALRVAAANVTSRPRSGLAGYVAELREGGRLAALQVDDDRQAAVQVAFDLSYAGLTDPTRRLFRLLGLAPGPDIGAAAAASLAGLPAERTRQLLAELTQAHLVTERVPGRFAFHDLLREYAVDCAGRVDAPADRRAALRRLLDHYLHSARSADLLLEPHRDQFVPEPAQPGVTPETFADRQQAVEWFTAEHPVLVAAVERAANDGFDVHAWQLARILDTFLDWQGHWHDWVRTQTAAVAAARRLNDRRSLAYAHRFLGRAYVSLRRFDDARSHLHQARDGYREVGDEIGQARVHLHLSWLASMRAQHAEAIRQSRQAFTMFRSAGNAVGQAYALNGIGWQLGQLGNHQEALRYCRQAVALFEQSGEDHGRATSMDSLGYALRQLGEHEQAAACYRQAVEIRAALGDRHREAGSLTGLGDAEAARGDHDSARQAWQRALQIYDELRHPDRDGVLGRLHGTSSNA